MINREQLRNLKLLTLMLVFFASCAVPIAPTGGPKDETPPKILESDPATGTTNISPAGIHIEFDEYIDQASVLKALQITPEFKEPATLKWRGRRVDITFPEALKENTTYIINFDNNLKDVHGVKLSSPITLAFSTGDKIDSGQISGNVSDPIKEKGIKDLNVYAWILPDSSAKPDFSIPPAYRTQTNNKGEFTFKYLADTTFFVAAFNDFNRNYTPDAGEPFAVPPQSVITSTPDSLTIWHNFYITEIDTIPPAVQRVLSRSNQRFEVSFSEGIVVDNATWQLQDSSENSMAIQHFWVNDNDRSKVIFFTDPLLDEIHFTAGGITDSAGNLMAEDSLTFEPRATDDTLKTRFIKFGPENPFDRSSTTPILRLDQHATITFTAPFDSISQYLTVTDTAGGQIPYQLATLNHTSYQVLIDRNKLGTNLVTVKFEGAIVNLKSGEITPTDSLFQKDYQLLLKKDFGSLSGVVLPDTNMTNPTLPNLKLALYQADNLNLISTIKPDSAGGFIFDQVPEANYLMQLFIDTDSNEVWSGGYLDPYRPAEAFMWVADSLRARPRWEVSLPDTIRFKP